MEQELKEVVQSDTTNYQNGKYNTLTVDLIREAIGQLNKIPIPKSNAYYMKNDKYYTPDISEFYEGFEFEELIENDDETEEWYQVVYHTNDFITDDGWIIQSPIYDRGIEDWIRVKYLDKEDIESLGFEHDQTTKDGSYFYKGSLIDDNQWSLCKNGLSIDIYDINNKSDFRFNGTIKNKSELKRLLKQLNIK